MVALLPDFRWTRGYCFGSKFFSVLHLVTQLFLMLWLSACLYWLQHPLHSTTLQLDLNMSLLEVHNVEIHNPLQCGVHPILTTIVRVS